MAHGEVPRAMPSHVPGFYLRVRRKNPGFRYAYILCIQMKITISQILILQQGFEHSV